MIEMDIIPGGLSLTIKGKAFTNPGTAGSMVGFWLKVARDDGRHDEVFIPFSLMKGEDKKIVSSILAHNVERKEP